MGRTIDINYNNVTGIENARELKLSVLLESDSFFYWVVNEANDVLKIEQVAGVDYGQLLSMNPDTVKVAFSHDIGYLIPEELLKDDFLSTQNQSLSAGHWQEFDLKSKVGKLFLNNPPPGDLSLSQHANVFISPIAKHLLFPEFVSQEMYEEAFVHLHFMEDLVYITAYRGEKLLIWQVVPLSSPHELQYFTLLLYFQFQLNRKEIPLLISGRLAAGSQLFHLLYPYFNKIKWANIPETDEGLKLPGNIPAHYLADLWLIHQCES